MRQYYVETWDQDQQDFTPQQGVRHGPWTQRSLRDALRQLRELGYESGFQNNPSVFIHARDDAVKTPFQEASGA